MDGVTFAAVGLGAAVVGAGVALLGTRLERRWRHRDERKLAQAALDKEMPTWGKQ
jgi:hypothetical protein